MIVSDRHMFVFVHIPKCAGVSVKTMLRPIDDSRGGFSRIAEHPVLGQVHYAHLPLRDLAAHFADTYAKLRAYRSVALVRDPVDRFASSLFQRMREFKGFAQSGITPAAFAAEAREVTRHLASCRGRLALEYVHFQRQAAFILEDGEQIVSRVFRLDQLDLAADFIAECTGIHIESGDRLNRSTELRSGQLQPLVRLLRIPYARFLPLNVRQQIRSAMHQSGLYGEVDKDRFVRPDGELSTFLKDYYRDDFVLFDDARKPTQEVVASRQDGLCAV